MGHILSLPCASSPVWNDVYVLDVCRNRHTRDRHVDSESILNNFFKVLLLSMCKCGRNWVQIVWGEGKGHWDHNETDYKRIQTKQIGHLGSDSWVIAGFYK